MAAETNTILTSDVARVRIIDFNYQFTGSLQKFFEVLILLQNSEFYVS